MRQTPEGAHQLCRWAPSGLAFTADSLGKFHFCAWPLGEEIRNNPEEDSVALCEKN